MGSDVITCTVLMQYQISIHAPRMGSDYGYAEKADKRHYFNPRSPHGERHGEFNNSSVSNGFQSTLPAWGATAGKSLAESIDVISIHAPRMGSDSRKNAFIVIRRNFNPRSPHGERRHAPRYSSRPKRFQSTLPAWGATTG